MLKREVEPTLNGSRFQSTTNVFVSQKRGMKHVELNVQCNHLMCNRRMIYKDVKGMLKSLPLVR